MTPAEFIALYPAFVFADTDWLTAELAAAELRVGDTWEDPYRDEIVGLETAATLARSPAGRAAQLLSQDGESVYSRALMHRYQAEACLAGGRLG